MTEHRKPNQRSADRETDQRLMELQSLFEMSQVLNSSLNIQTILNNLLLTPMGRMMISKGLVLVKDEQGAFEVKAVKGLSRELYGKKLYLQDTLEVPILLPDEQNVTGYQWKKSLAAWGIELVLPIISTNQMVGILGLGQKVAQQKFTNSEIEYLSSLSNIAASSIENALVYQKLERVNRQLDKKIQELNTLFDIGKELNSTLDKQKIVTLLMFAIMGEMLVNKVIVYLKEGGSLKWVASKGVSEYSPDYRALTGKGFLKSLARITNAFALEEADLNRNLQVLHRRGFKVIVPMRVQEKTSGVIVLGDKITREPFKKDDVEFLSTLCNRAMLSIENARLFEEALEKQKIEKELNIAREIQQRLLPERTPRIERFDIAGINLSSQQVGGDYYDYIPIDDHRIGIAIADVSGKGVPASLLMSNLHAALHSLISSEVDVAAISGRINNLIHAHTSQDKFITFFYAEVNTADKTMTYVNAGHNPPFLYHADGSYRILDKGGLILGVLPNMPYETETVQLQKGDVLFLYTDGVSEAINVKNRQFEEWRIQDILKANLDKSAEELMKVMINELQDFTMGAPQSDDITMVVLKVTD